MLEKYLFWISVTVSRFFDFIEASREKTIKSSFRRKNPRRAKKKKKRNQNITQSGRTNPAKLSIVCVRRMLTGDRRLLESRVVRQIERSGDCTRSVLNLDATSFRTVCRLLCHLGPAGD